MSRWYNGYRSGKAGPVGVAFSAVCLISIFLGLQLVAELEAEATSAKPAAGSDAQESLKYSCKPTPPDSLGPFYKPDAPMRSSVGKGYTLSGTVKSAEDCSPIDGARIEFWLAGPNGSYDDEHRATVLSNESGGYSFESNFPPPYSGRPSHIHVKTTAEGYKTLVTQHYPVAGHTSAKFDLVLIRKDQE